MHSHAPRRSHEPPWTARTALPPVLRPFLPSCHDLTTYCMQVVARLNQRAEALMQPALIRRWGIAREIRLAASRPLNQHLTSSKQTRLFGGRVRNAMSATEASTQQPPSPPSPPKPTPLLPPPLSMTTMSSWHYKEATPRAIPSGAPTVRLPNVEEGSEIRGRSRATVVPAASARPELTAYPRKAQPVDDYDPLLGPVPPGDYDPLIGPKPRPTSSPT